MIPPWPYCASHDPWLPHAHTKACACTCRFTLTHTHTHTHTQIICGEAETPPGHHLVSLKIRVVDPSLVDFSETDCKHRQVGPPLGVAVQCKLFSRNRIVTLLAGLCEDPPELFHPAQMTQAPVPGTQMVSTKKTGRYARHWTETQPLLGYSHTSLHSAHVMHILLIIKFHCNPLYQQHVKLCKVNDMWLGATKGGNTRICLGCFLVTFPL
jgi:hypothetical protein